MRTDYICRQELEHLLAALTRPNRLAMEVSLHTGLRISDVLNFRSERLSKRFYVRELKTGKRRRIYLSNELLDRCQAIAGKIYVFEGRLNQNKHRTRQAVWKDLKRIARMFRLEKNIAPHSARKVYAVDFYKKSGGDLQRVKELLNHTDEAVTALYALSDQLVKRHHGENYS